MKRTEKTACDDPRAPPRGVQPGWRSRWRRALGGEQGMESRRQPMCPCGWHQENPGGTQGHGPHQGAKSAYNAPRGGGPGTLKIFAAPPPRAYIILVPRAGIWNPEFGTRLLWRVHNLEPGSYGGFKIWNPAPMAGATHMAVRHSPYAIGHWPCATGHRHVP